MPKSKKAYYAVAVGRKPGVYLTWEECKEQVTGVPNMHKGFSMRHEAEQYVQANRKDGGSAPSGPQHASSSLIRPKVSIPSPQRAATQMIKGSSSAKGGERTVDAEDAQSGWDVVYTDGACSNNQNAALAKAGVGVWWGHGDPRNLSERCPGDQTNNRAELMGLVRVFEENPPKSGAKLHILTDSKYAIKCLEDWLPKWINSNGTRGRPEPDDWIGSSGQPVKNARLLFYLAKLLAYRRLICGHSAVKIEHVRGHQGIEGNEMADRLAVSGCYQSSRPEVDWNARRHDIEADISAESARRKTVRTLESQAVQASQTSEKVPKPTDDEDDMYNDHEAFGDLDEVTLAALDRGEQLGDVGEPSATSSAARLEITEGEGENGFGADDNWMDDLDEDQLAQIEQQNMR